MEKPGHHEKSGISAEAMEGLRQMTSDLSNGFQCLICPMIFRQLFSLVQHQQRHFVEEKLIQKYTDEGCSNLPTTVPLGEIEEAANVSTGAHLTEESSSEVRPHRCPNCSKTYSFGYYLENHMKNCRPKRESKLPAFCEVCGLQYGSRPSLVRHQIERHGIQPKDASEGGVPCEYCDRIFLDIRILDEHIANDHAGDTPFKCGVCEDSFALKSELDGHTLKKHNAGFMCDQCSKIFKKKRSLESHVKQAHSEELGISKDFSCEICDKKFAQERYLKSHYMITHKEKTFHCQYCSKSFSEACYLRRHEKIHLKDRPFKCRFCHKGFLLKNNRENHELTHTGEKPLKCRFCLKGFIQKNNLKKHELSHEMNLSNEIPYRYESVTESNHRFVMSTMQMIASESSNSQTN